MSATAQLALDVRGFLAGVDLAKQGLQNFRGEAAKVDEGNGMMRLQVAAIGLAAGLAGLAMAMYKGVTSTVQLGARLVDVSYKSGLAVKEIMALERSLDEVGGKAEDAAPATEKFNQAIQQAAQNSGPLVGILQNAGISMGELADMSVADRMMAVGNAIRSIQHPTEQAQAAVAAFGSSGVKMLAALDPKNLNSSAAAMGAQAQIMQANAGVFARIMQLMGAQGSSLNSLAVAVKGKLQGLFTGIAAGIAPTILKIMEASSTGGTSLAAAIRSFSPALEPLAALVESLVSMDLAGVGAQLGAGAAAIVEAIMNGDAIAYIKAGLMVAGAVFREALAEAAGGVAAAFAALSSGVDFGAILAGFETGMIGVGRLFLGLLQQGIARILNELRQSSSIFEKLIPVEAISSLANAAGKNIAGGKADASSGASQIMAATKEAAATLAKNAEDIPSAFSRGAAAAKEGAQQDTAGAQATMDAIKTRAQESAAATAERLRTQFATPAAGEQAINLGQPAPTTAQAPLGSIVSSMAKIGGDVGGPQTGALDVARQQLMQQERTAENTAKMVEKLNKLTPAQSTQTASIYS
jgi:hypothetical protein